MVRLRPAARVVPTVFELDLAAEPTRLEHWKEKTEWGRCLVRRTRSEGTSPAALNHFFLLSLQAALTVAVSP